MRAPSTQADVLDQEVQERPHPRGHPAALAQEHGVDLLQVARVVRLQHRHQPAGRDVVAGVEQRQPRQSDAGHRQALQRSAVADLGVAERRQRHHVAVLAQRPAVERAGAIEAEAVVARQVRRRPRHPVARKIGGRGEDGLARRAQLARHQRRTLQRARAHRDVRAMLDQVDHLVGQHDVERDLRIALEERGHQRQQRSLAERHVRVHAEPAARRVVGRRAALGLGQVGQQSHAALVEHAAFRRQLHLPRGAIEQAHAQARLQASDQLADGRRGHRQRPGSGREAALLDHAHEHLHLAEPVDVVAFHELDSQMFIFRAV